MMSFPLWMYLGVREESEKKVLAKKEVKIEGGLFLKSSSLKRF